MRHNDGHLPAADIETEGYGIPQRLPSRHLTGSSCGQEDSGPLHCCNLGQSSSLRPLALREPDLLRLHLPGHACFLVTLWYCVPNAGHTNSFHVASGSELARCYNDISVMENHHCAMAFSILDREDCGLLQHLDRSVQQARDLSYSSYLHDMWYHHLRWLVSLMDQAGLGQDVVADRNGTLTAAFTASHHPQGLAPAIASSAESALTEHQPKAIPLSSTG